MFHYDKDPPSHPFTSLSCSISCPSGGGRPRGAAGDIWAVSPPRRTPLTSACPWTLRPVPAAPCSLLNVGVSAALPLPRVKKQQSIQRKTREKTPLDLTYGVIIFVSYLYIHILVDAEPWFCCWCQKRQIQKRTLKVKGPLRIWKIHPPPPGGGAYLSCWGWGGAQRDKLSVLHSVDIQRERRTAALTGQCISPRLHKASFMPELHHSHHWRAACTSPGKGPQA